MSKIALRQIVRTSSMASLLICGLLVAAMAALPAAGRQDASKQDAAQASQVPNAKAFASPEDAAAAVYAAAKKNDEKQLLAILGAGAKGVIEWSDDPKEREARHQSFAQKYDQMHRLVREPDGTVTLYVGAENWPAPIPLVEYNGAWYFDAELGRQEIMYRRIGRNEMEALQVCRALVDAENDYYAAQHHYTDKLLSANGARDGLYWRTTEDFGRSPIGPYLAHAGASGPEGANRQPFHGYYYRVVLLAAPGAEQEKGKTSGGFVVLAFPAEYRSSGVMSFYLAQGSVPYEKDLGASTASLASSKVPNSPDNTWKKVE